jgi:spermidine/putrescine transport system permease protein
MNAFLKRLRDKDTRNGWLLISPTMLWMIGLLIIPLILVIITSFGRRTADGEVIYTFTFDNYLRLAGFTPKGFDTLYGEILWRSLVLAFQTTALTILVGFPLAYFVARAPAKRRNTFLFLVLVPLWTNFVIRIYAWIMILRTQGVLNGLLAFFLNPVLPVLGHMLNPALRAVGLWPLAEAFAPLEMLYTPGAVLVGMVYEFLPFMILPMYTSLEKIEPSLYEAAADLGANARHTFLRVTLPLSAPGMVAGTILVFIPVMGTFIVSDILGGRQVILVGNLIQRQFLDARDPTFGSAASIILMVMTLIVTVFYARRFGFGDEVSIA